jgi:hypothetical protein
VSESGRSLRVGEEAVAVPEKLERQRLELDARPTLRLHGGCLSDLIIIQVPRGRIANRS